jgi:hypothetical protein
LHGFEVYGIDGSHTELQRLSEFVANDLVNVHIPSDKELIVVRQVSWDHTFTKHIPDFFAEWARKIQGM